MVFDVSVALTWILFLALFPMAFFWLRRAWRILVKRDFSEVALRRGESPAEPVRWAPYEMAINGLAGVIVLIVIVWVLTVGHALRALDRHRRQHHLVQVLRRVSRSAGTLTDFTPKPRA